MGGVTDFAIRAYRAEDKAAVVGVWYRASQAVYTFLPTWQEFTSEVATTVFREQIAPRCQIWLGVQDAQIVAYMAMKGSYIDRLYVDPPFWRLGWGTRLLAHARQISPTKLELHTHQENLGARALYERNGFVAVEFGISPPPESAPDVFYRWETSAPTAGA
jgi:ribosomal protein S18 acetylase RimI-like enzyme